MATILTINLIGVGVLVVRFGGQRPMLAAPASALHDAGLPVDAGHTSAATGGVPAYDPSATFAAPDQLPVGLPVRPRTICVTRRPF